MKLLHKLFAVAFLPAFFASLVILAIVWSGARRDALDRASADAVSSIESEKQRILLHFTGIRAVLESEARRLLPGKPQTVLAELTALEKRLGGKTNGLFLNLPDGSVLGTHGSRFDTRDRYYYPLIQRGETVISRIIDSRADGQPSVIVIAPLIDSLNRYHGALAASVPVGDMLSNLGGSGSDSAARILLVDDAGRINTQHPPITALDSAIMMHAGTVAGKAVFMENIQGVSYHLCIAKVPGTPWSLVSYFDESSAYRSMAGLAFPILLTICATGLLVIVAFRFMRSQLYAPLQRLALAHTRVAHGELSAQLQHEADPEFDDLSVSFNSMAAQLQASVGRTTQILETARELFIVTTPDGCITVFNTAAERLLGYTAADVLGKGFVEVLFPADNPEYLNTESRIASGSFHDFLALFSSSERECTLHHRTGTGIPVSLTVSPMHSSDGLLTGHLFIAREIGGLKQSEARFRQLIESAPLGIFLVRNGTILYANSAFARLVASPSAEELIGCDIMEFVVPKERSRIAGYMAARAKDDNVPNTYESTGIRRDGSRFHYDINISRIDLLDGPATLAIVVDISVRKNAELRLAESESAYRALFEQTPFSVVLNSLSGEYIDVNNAFLRGTGLERSEVIGKNAVEAGVITREDHAAIIREIERCNGVLNSHECITIRPKTGERRNVLLSTAVIRFQNEQTILTITNDITERKRAEEALRISEERFRSMIQGASDMIFIIDDDGRLTYESPSVSRILGYPQNFFIGQTPFGLIHPDDIARVRRDLDQVFHFHNDGLPTHFRLKKADGGWIQLEALASNMLDNPAIRGSVITIRDVTERFRAEGALQQSEELYRRLVTAIPDVIIRTDCEGNILFINETGFPALGYRSNERILGKNMMEFVQPSERERAAINLRLMFERYIGPQEYHLMSEDGEPVIVEVNGDVLRSPDGTPYGTVFLVRDIRERKQAEAALRESEERLSSFIDETLEGIVILDGDGRLTVWNRTAATITGIPAGEAIGQYWWDIAWRILPKVRRTEKRLAELKTMVREALTSGIPVFSSSRHFIIEHVDGTERSIEQRVFSIKTPHGNRFATIFVDVTERAKAEAERERLVSAVEQAGEIIVITDAYGTIQYVNPAFETITGYSRAEAIGRNPRILKSGVHESEFYSSMWNTIASGKSWTGRFVNRKKNGTLFSEEATISPIRNTAGIIVNYVAVKRDITEHLHMLEERERLQTQLAQAQKMESIGRLAGGVAHDFNNMLSVILGYSEMLSSKVLPDSPFYHGLDEIGKAAERSANLTRQLLAFARKQAIHPRVLDLNDAIAGMLKMLQRLLGENINLVWKPGQNLWPVKLDPSQIDQVLANLTVNSRDAIGASGTIVIETSNIDIDESYASAILGASSGPHVLVTVSDDGCGMDRETITHVFEPFFTTKEAGKGTGLGLATVYGIVRQNNGFINVYSEPGIGTTFKIYIPRLSGSESAETAEQPLFPIPRGTETVLVVEDEPMILDLARSMLEELGYRVLAADHPRKALDLAREHRNAIHLMLTDIVMPDMNGKELAEAIRDLMPGIRCLFMSGYTPDVVAHHGITDKTVRIIQKPFSLRELAETLRAMFAQEPSAQE